ncbi:MAG: sugar ABC transporter permease [Clostridia bacterium]|nr:sugar ABC transporter permease [Clostridia bacterium]
MTNNMKLNQTLSAKSAGPKKRKIASLDRRKARAGWIFLLPFIIGFVLVYLPMVFDSIKLSFTELKYLPGGGYDPQWVGWDNYKEALLGAEYSETFIKTLGAGLLKMLFDIPAILIFSLFMAVLLNQKMVGRAAFRAIFFSPVVLSTGIMESIDAQNILNDQMDNGIDDGSGSNAANEIVTALDVQRLFAGMKIGTKLTTYVVTMVNDIFNIVNRSGVQMLIFLAALQSISPAIYESCRIDGATSWETFWKITLPMISPMILVNAVYTVIDSFTTDSNPVMKYVSEVYTKSNGQTVSSAMAWIYFLIIILIVGVISAICSAFVFYQKRDM